jgi:creatinine amidohydrolase/Fe(II)-dependent formamide hydrolase-like protein
MMRHPHRWEQLLPEEFYEEFRRAPIVYWACGAMEEHGLQNALGVDPLTAHEVCLRAAAISGGIVHPLVPLAPAYIPGLSREELRAQERELYPPSLWVSRELCEQAYTELLESMADLGFRVGLAVAGHYPADLLLRELAQGHGGKIGGMCFWGGGIFQLLEEVLPEEIHQEPELFGHGLMWETSCVMALNSGWVDLERVDRLKASPLPSQLKPAPDSHLARVKEASAAFGDRYLNAAAARLAQIGRELLA